MQVKLTRREKEVFTHLLNGLVPKEIAGKLKISYDTVVSHQKKLYRKLNVHSIEELFDKYQNNKEEIIKSANGNGNGNGNENGKKKPSFFQNITKHLIPAFIAAVIVICFFFSVRFITSRFAGEKEIPETETDPRIYMENGTYFTGVSFDNIHLNVNRWSNIEGVFYGEQYFTGNQLLLSDIYSGSFEELMNGSNLLRLKLSGTIDKECKNMLVMIQYVHNGQWYYEYDGKWHTAFAHSTGKKISIGPGDFSEIFLLQRESSFKLPEGASSGDFFVVAIFNTLLAVNGDWIDDIGDRIPENLPNGSRWATINNLKVEPVRGLRDIPIESYFEQ